MVGKVKRGLKMLERPPGLKNWRPSLVRAVEHDNVVAKRGKPSLPKLKFMEGLGPEDPRYDADARAA